MSIKVNSDIINLQLFAEGSGTGDGGATGVTGEAAVPQGKGVKNPLENVQYGIQPDAQATAVQESVETPPDRNAEFEKLIKGEYKEQFNAKTQDIVQKRLKSTNETVDKFNALIPTLELLANKYGVDVNDIAALNTAIEDDDAYFEDEALEKGLTVQQLKEIRKMEKENSELKRQMREQEAQQNANKLYSAWIEQAENVKSVYPSFDLSAEMQNPRFVDLLRSNVDVRTAYEVLHKDEIIPAAMQFTAQKVEQKLANKIIANGARPTENGISSQAASQVKSDVSQLSKADLAEVAKRVLRGEKISFG
jgi:hypothetical protein